MSIQLNSPSNWAVNKAAVAFQIDQKNDRYITMAAKFAAGAATNAVLTLAALVETVAAAVFYTTSFLPLYIASQEETIKSLANRVKQAASAAQQAAGQIPGVWAKEAPKQVIQQEAPAPTVTKWENFLKKTTAFRDQALASSKPYFEGAKARLSSAGKTAWNHKGKIATAGVIGGALATEWYLNYPVSSRAQNAANSAFEQLSNLWNPKKVVEPRNSLFGW